MDLSIQTAALIDRTRPYVNPWEDIRNHIPIVDFDSSAIKGKLKEELLKSFVWVPMKDKLSKVVLLIDSHRVISAIWLASMWMSGAMAYAMVLAMIISTTWFLPQYLKVVRSAGQVGSQLRY